MKNSTSISVFSSSLDFKQVEDDYSTTARVPGRRICGEGKHHPKTMLSIFLRRAIKAMEVMADILCTISFSFRQNSLWALMPLVRGRGISSIVGSSGKNEISLNSLEVTCTQTKSPVRFMASADRITAGLSLVADKSVKGKCTNTISRCRNAILYHFLRLANASSQWVSSGLFQASASESWEANVTGSTAVAGSTIIPISSATRISRFNLSAVSASMFNTVFMPTNILKPLAA